MKDVYTGTKIDRGVTSPKNTWSINDFRQELAKINAQRAKKGEKPLTFFEFTRNAGTRMNNMIDDAIANINDVNIYKNLRNRVKEFMMGVAAEQAIAKLTYIIKTMFVTFRYLRNHVKTQADQQAMSDILDMLSEMSDVLADMNATDDDNEFTRLVNKLIDTYHDLEKISDNEIKRLTGAPMKPNGDYDITTALSLRLFLSSFSSSSSKSSSSSSTTLSLTVTNVDSIL